MEADEIRFLFAYDRWATRRVLGVLGGVDPAAWTRPNAVGDRGLGAILVHHLGASQRWRIGLESQGESEGPEPEREPLPTIDELRERWEGEWAAADAWLPTLTDGFIGYVQEGGPRLADARARREITARSTERKRRRCSPPRANPRVSST